MTDLEALRLAVQQEGEATIYARLLRIADATQREQALTLLRALPKAPLPHGSGLVVVYRTPGPSKDDR
jgi:hypothetical protein